MEDNAGFEDLGNIGESIENTPPEIEEPDKSTETEPGQPEEKEEFEDRVSDEAEETRKQNEEFIDLVKGKDYFEVDAEGNRVVEELNDISQQANEFKEETYTKSDEIIR